ncbi:MAG: hypothetical protein GX548_12825 [Lentisphaerae bacterium]|nr:hypothetical protein [Lentisphaerota bacterium]
MQRAKLSDGWGSWATGRCLWGKGWMLAVLLGAVSARAQDERGYRGRWNEWTYEPMALSSGVWRVTIPAVEAEDNDFKIGEPGESWAYQWTHGAAVPLATVVSAFTGGGNSEMAATPGRYYTFAMDDVAAGEAGQMIVQETEAEPVEIASVDPAMAESNTVVTLATSAAPGPGERLFVRYTFHNWISSAFAEASGSGTNWTAEIPHAPENAGRTCAFYALTTTVAGPTHSDADLQTLRWNDNAGAGFSFVVPGDPPPARLVINEVLSSNDSSEQDEDGDYSDWLEIWNDSVTAVNLDGWGLSDSDSNPFKWTFGAVTIQPGEFLVVWASDKDRPAITNGNQLHTSFAISAGGEELLLTQPDGTLMDRFEPVAIPTDFSYGRQPDGTGPWKYFTNHTPGAPNTTTGYTAILEPPVYSIPGGFFTTNVDVTLSTAQTGAVVRYTLDGSEPTEASPIFTNAIPLGSKAGTSNDLSEIPTNFEPTGPDYYEGWQPPAGEVFKFHVLRARAFQESALPSPAVTQSYIMDAAGTNRYTLPVVSIATDAANLFDDDIGIYTPVNDNMLQSGSDWERPGTIEFFEPGGALAFRGDIDIRLHGNTTRSRPRKALRIYAKTPSTFEYPIFPDKPLAKFDTFILRNGGNDWGNGVIRDLFLQSLAADTGLDRQHGRLVLVFLNGEYWGLHDLRERFDDGYIEHHYGLEEAEFVQVEMDNTVSASPYVPIYDRGNPELGGDYSNLWHYIGTHDLSDPANYAAVQDRLSVESFIDFFQAHIFFGNTDWPGNNVRAWRSVATNRIEGAPARHDARWRFMLYDTDFGFGSDFIYVPGREDFAQHDTLSFAASPDETQWPNPQESTLMFRRLLENDDFRSAFITRFCDRLNTAYSRAHVTNTWAQWVAVAEPEMAEHVHRWRQPTNWTHECDRIRSYGEQRTGAVWGHLRTFFGLDAPVPLAVNVTNAAEGFIRVNAMDLDEGTAGFGGYPWTGDYFTNCPVTLTAMPREGFRFVEWRRDGAPAGVTESIEAGLSGPVSYEAVFEPMDIPDTELIHYWNFNDTENLLAPAHTRVAGAGIAIQTGAQSVVTSGTGQEFVAENARFGDEAGAHLRLNDPIGATMEVALPTTGFEDIVVKVETRRSGSGAGSQVVSYTLDGSAYTALATIGVTEVPTLITFPFADIPGADDNPDFGLRIEFAQGAGGTAGNNRFDNWTAEGVGPSAGYAGWQQGEFTPEELADPAVSGPLAVPAGSGIPNLLRYGLGMGRNDDYASFRPTGDAGEGLDLRYRHRRLLDPASGVEYVIEVESDLAGGAWPLAVLGGDDDLVEISATPTGDGLTETVEYRINTGRLTEPRFFRLRIRTAD